MSNWERREADSLAYAIGNHCKKYPQQKLETDLLRVVLQLADDASKTVSTNAGALTQMRSLTCAICRGCRLYDCDVPQGWSNQCALIHSNSTEFGSL